MLGSPVQIWPCPLEIAPGSRGFFLFPSDAPERLAPELLEPILVGGSERELLAQRVIGDAGEFAQRLVDVLGPHADALVLVELQRRGAEGDGKLLSVGGANDAVAFDAAAEEHGGADRPVVLAVARVVVR